MKFSVHDHCETLVSAREVKGRIAWWVKKARRTQMSVDGVTIRKTRTLEGVHSRPGTLLRPVFSTVTKAKVLIRNLTRLLTVRSLPRIVHVATSWAWRIGKRLS